MNQYVFADYYVEIQTPEEFLEAMIKNMQV